MPEERGWLLFRLAVLLSCSVLCAATWKAEECDVRSSGPLCFNGGSSVLMPAAAASDLVGHWTFDSEVPFDVSGGGNHGEGVLEHGPSPAGGGYSAYFAKNFLTVPDAPGFHSKDFTYSFWVYLLGSPLGEARDAPKWCPLLRKGVYVSAAEEFSNAPALLFSRKTGHLRASVTTTSVSLGDGEYVDSHARLQPNRWVHIALVHRHNSGAAEAGSGSGHLLLYVNGILDARLVLHGRLEQNEYPLYVGGDPFTAEQCGFEMYLDDLRLNSRAVAPHELQAEAAPTLGGVDPSFVHLGCTSCSLEEAVTSCPHTRHVCSALELHTGGYQVAKALGWLASGMHVWTHAAVANRGAAPSAGAASGLALCCEGAS